MNSLIWKQWHESKGYLAIFTVWMVLAACYAVAYEMGHRFHAVVGHFSGLVMFYMISAAVFLAMRTACGEYTVGTHSFSASLPVSRRRMATVRLLGASATLVSPILIAALLLSIALASGLVQQGVPRVEDITTRLPEREVATSLVALEQLWSVAGIAAFAGVQLLLVLSLLGCWLRSQTRVGLLGAILALGSLIASGLLWYGPRRPVAQLVYGAVFPQSLMIQWGYGAETGGYTDHELAHYRWLALAFAVPLLAVIASTFVTHYGSFRSTKSSSRPSRFRIPRPAVLSHLPIRWPSKWMAMIWVDLRQSVPLALFGLLLAVLIAVAQVSVEQQPTPPIPAGADIGNGTGTGQVLMRGHVWGESVLKEMPHSTWIVGTLWAVVVGSSLYSAELGSGLGSFWRSRPISPAMWFWCKFLVGLVAVLSILDGVTIIASWNSPRTTMTTGMSWAYVGCMPILHALMYALAVLGTCWFRRPVIGGFLAIVAFAVLNIVIEAFTATMPLEPIRIYNALLMAELGGQVDFTKHWYPVVYGGLTVGIVVISAVAYRFARPLQPTPRWYLPASD